MRTRRIVSLLVALVAGIVWVLGTLANPANAWDPLNFVLRVVAGVVTVAAVAEWVVLTVRAVRRDAEVRGPGGADGPADAAPAQVVALGTVPVVPREPVAPPEPVPPPCHHRFRPIVPLGPPPRNTLRDPLCWMSS
ncbi:hypothetical protein HLB15_20880 [Promicromonospora citrea]|uniref:hypothetical protein n=1 Tax=Promicromonospora citrea TaxID=43677 RepID=UPI00148792E4|nr:hypothetical protein [Promicromonospora citrea]NNH54682.1 hypothetical protein [Promicromonospora citrea]